MKLPNFEMAKAKWDHWKAFHINHNRSGSGGDSYGAVFIQFDTGELVCQLSNWTPENRIHYRDLNITVRSTTDEQCPKLFTDDGETVVPAWLNRTGMQVLLIDWDHGVAVRVDHRLGEKNEALMPERLRGKFSAYYAGVKSKPLAAPIKVEKPMRFTKEQLDHVDGLCAASKAWVTYNAEEVEVTRSKTSELSSFVLKPIRDKTYLYWLAREFKDLSLQEKVVLSTHTPERGFDETHHTYLRVNKLDENRF